MIKGRNVTIGLSIFGVILVTVAGYIGLQIYLSGFWHGPDVKFGDQHLKTSVALIEMHKVRFGHYPKSLRELKFVGDWDEIALNSVRYIANADQDKYCVEVTHGWIGKPDLQVPAEF